ncbi:hypothetical protein DFA_05395 [Cavenderia fasciculata]|uniref:RING-type domain-containing protein n=1 Tax=Cavenderia fasciculata TaxID=261658 RepID=F4PL41_CACFS|nr:uncharacterized protein DFA_05395 [Cavenderia fasciculata]EGG23263.1 hypothetical protein DFA_05395 [Cavenderia fasciculata]|eukprot:XP_004361114.1 hypothetical protein DFA_05395 [Cavenderia fasciculata]
MSYLYDDYYIPYPTSSLLINIDSLYLGFCNIKEASMTQCGHNFCSKCIFECVNRNKKCPCCNAPTTKESIVRNHQLDKIISIIDKEKEDASKNYFNNLIANSQNQQHNNNRPNNHEQKLSPIQDLFSKYIKTSLMAYDEFYNQLELKCKEGRDRLEQEKNAILLKHKGDDLILQQTKEEYRYSLEKLEKSNQQTIDLLLKSFEEYETKVCHLKSVAVTPNFVNIQTSIIIPDKDITIEHISLKPSATIYDVKQILVEKLNQRGGDYTFIKFNDNCKFVAQTPMAMGANYISLDDESKPLSMCNLPQGSKIIVQPGGISVQGDIPKECFSTSYKPGDTMDYYRCNDCAYNWICKPCADYCHKGHNKIIYLPNHKASFACCYDQRHNKCKIAKN